MKKTFFLIFSLLFLFSSCSNLVNQMHADLDKEENRTNRKIKKKRKRYSSQRRRRKRRSPRFRPPRVKRSYLAQNIAKKRYKADDLNDNAPDGSLWAGSGKNNYLFTSNESKRTGDIVLINVMAALKNEITAELKRAFPVRTKKSKAKKAAAAPGKAPAATAAKTEAAQDDPTKVYDKISSIIIEQINNDHILLRGQKKLLYNDRKRIVEIQALVAKRDLGADDIIKSDKILETSVKAIR